MDSAGIPLKALQMVLRERALRTKIDALAFDDSRAFAQLLGALDALEERPPDVANGAAKRSTASQAAVRTY